VTIDPMHQPRVTVQESQPSAGALGPAAVARMEFHQGSHSTLVQQAWRVAEVVGACLATWRWCQSRVVEGWPHKSAPATITVVRVVVFVTYALALVVAAIARAYWIAR
jgi:hypothetical protein